MVGRPGIGSYALFPAEGAQALRMLEAGTPLSGVAAWYEQTCGSALDVDDDLGAGRAFGEFNCGRDALEARPIDDGAHEITEIGDISDADLGDEGAEVLPELRPQGLGNINSRSGRAFLPLIFISAADDCGRERHRVG